MGRPIYKPVLGPYSNEPEAKLGKPKPGKLVPDTTAKPAPTPKKPPKG